MNCPNCQATNQAGARFCVNCGTALPMTCANCGAALPEGAKFCHNCGAVVAASGAVAPKGSGPLSPPPIQQPAPAPDSLSRLSQYIPKELLNKLEAARRNRSMEGERRIVTTLFCDVKGSTAMAEQLDPEEWTEIMNGTFKFLIEPVYKYEGTLARLMGDAILAFFGAPIAHEDDPQRAVLAGLEIIEAFQPYRAQVQHEYGFDLNVRIGINTGLVVVGEVGSDLRVEYTAMGDAVNLAARMEQTAEPGTVQITANTYKSISKQFDFEALGPIEVKGKSEPVEAYRVLSQKEGVIATRGIEGLSSPLVGRDKELQGLKARVSELAEGSGGIATVVGEAGLGKSRLIAELRKYAQGQDGGEGLPLRWYEGRSLSYETNTPYAPFLDLMGSFFEIHPQDSDAERLGKIREHLAFMPHGEEFVPFFGTLLGIKLPPEEDERVKFLDPPNLRGRIFYAIQGLFETLASRGPVVLVFEDLHWVDPTSLELLLQLVSLTDRTKLLIVALFRPQRQEASWQFHEMASREYPHRYTHVALEPLDEASSRTLVANLLEIEDLPEKVRALILRKAEGNPFFVEEVIRSLLDAGLVVREGEHWRATREIENVGVPDTLAGVITARLDRLDSESKHVAQTASVVGREFGREVMLEVYDEPAELDPCLSELQRRELVREKSQADKRAYLFKHVLTQETAYATVLLSRRRELHRRVAECLERVEPERVNDIARHFLEARENARALPYLVQAGEQAARGYATQEALNHYTRALEILKTNDAPEYARRIYEGIGGVRMLVGDIPGAMQHYNEMLQYAEEHNLAPMQVSAHNKLAQIAMWTGQPEVLMQHLDTSEHLARKHRDFAGLSEMYTIRCGVCTVQADFDTAVRYMGDSIDTGRQTNSKETMAYGLTHTSQTKTYLTLFDEAWDFAQQAWDVAEEAGDRRRQSELLSYSFPMYQVRNGNLAEALNMAERGISIAQRIGWLLGEAMGCIMAGTVSHALGRYEQAIAYDEQAWQAVQRSGMLFIGVFPLSDLGSVYLEISYEMLNKTNEYHGQAMQLIEYPAGTWGGAMAWSDLGFAALEQGNVDAAEGFFQKGLTVPTTEWLIYKPRLLAGAALVALARSEYDEAVRLIGQARGYAQERKMVNFYPLLDLVKGRVSVARGQWERGLEAFTRAEEVSRETGMLPMLWQAQAHAGHALLRLGKQGEADMKRLEAEGTVREIAARIENEELRGTYLDCALQKLESAFRGAKVEQRDTAEGAAV